MQSAKKVRALSALSIAAAAAAGLSFVTAPHAQAATLSLYYNGGGNGKANLGNVDTIAYGTSSSLGSSSTISPTGATVTVSIPVGDYIGFGLSAVVTNNVNAVAGQTMKSASGTPQGAATAQPTYLGLSELSVTVSSTDATGSTLTPLVGAIRDTFNGAIDYNSTAKLNSALATASASTDVGDVLQSDTPGGGDVGDHYGITPWANTSASAGTSAGNTELTAFTTQTNVNSAANATVAFNGLLYEANAVGSVTLSPVALSGGTEYWSYNAGAALTTGNAKNIYEATHFTNPGDNLNDPLPLLVINITGSTTSPPPTNHAIISLTSTAPTSYGTSQGSLSITGSDGSYTHASATFPAVATGYVSAGTFNPATDTEVYGVDVLDGGAQATQAELTALVTEINAGDATNGVPASSVVASSSATGTNPYGFTSSYNLYLVASPGVAANDFLGIDLSSTNDAALSGYTFSAVTVVPEPMSLGLLALGGLGLMTRRNRRKA